MTRHEAYGGNTEQRYLGAREDMTGGEYLGTSARPDLMETGDIITATEAIEPEGWSAYWYDPELKIEGDYNSYVRSRDGDENTWIMIRKQS